MYYSRSILSANLFYSICCYLYCFLVNLRCSHCVQVTFLSALFLLFRICWCSCLFGFCIYDAMPFPQIVLMHECFIRHSDYNYGYSLPLGCVCGWVSDLSKGFHVAEDTGHGAPLWDWSNKDRVIRYSLKRTKFNCHNLSVIQAFFVEWY